MIGPGGTVKAEGDLTCPALPCLHDPRCDRPPSVPGLVVKSGTDPLLPLVYYLLIDYHERDLLLHVFTNVCCLIPYIVYPS